MKDDGLHRCAIGCLLTPDGLSETIAIGMERAIQHNTITGNVAVRDIGANFATLQELGYKLKDLKGVNEEFLDEAQMIHDSAGNWDHTGRNFKVEALDALAIAFELTVPVEEAEGAPLEAVLV